MSDDDTANLTDEEIARAQWEWMRERYMNMGTPWDRLTPEQREWCKAWVRQARQQGILPEHKPKVIL